MRGNYGVRDEETHLEIAGIWSLDEAFLCDSDFLAIGFLLINPASRSLWKVRNTREKEGVKCVCVGNERQN